MRSPFARWKLRHLAGSWLGYWAVLAAVTLTPGAIAMWKVTRDGAKGSASISLGNGALHAIVTAPASTLWEASVPLVAAVLAIAGPPLVLWLCWVLTASASSDSPGQHLTEQLGRGDELPLRSDDRARDTYIDPLRNDSVPLYDHRGSTMTDMGTFRTEVELESAARPGVRLKLSDVLVDTGAELSWFPSSTLESLGIERWKQARFRQASGTIVTRWTGAASLYVGDWRTVDEVVFGEPGDLVILGARSLEGLNVHVDPVRKMLVDAGPAPAAAVA